MNERAARIHKLIVESEKTYQELEKLTGIKKSSLQRYASGVTEKIPLTAIEKLAVAFSVSESYIMWGQEKQSAELGWEENGPAETTMQITEGEQKLLDLFRKVPETQQQMVLQMITVALKSIE